jgi:hypothetical protein
MEKKSISSFVGMAILKQSIADILERETYRKNDPGKPGKIRSLRGHRIVVEL